MDAFNILIWLSLSQVSYQGLDTENQRLQKALENSSKKIQQLEAELQEVETENQTLQRNLEELKISSKRLEQLEQEVGKAHIQSVVIIACLKYFLSFEVFLDSTLLWNRPGWGMAVGGLLTQLQLLILGWADSAWQNEVNKIGPKTVVEAG